MSPAGLFTNSVGALTVPQLTERETAALVVVAVSLLFFRAFRERYLLAWSAGWIAYGALLFAARASALHPASKALASFVEADFVLAMGLFAAAALMSAESRRALTTLIALSWLWMVCAAMNPLYFPESTSVRLGLEIACRVVALGAAIELVLSRVGRIGFGPWLFGAGLLTLNLDWPRLTNHIPPAGYLFAEILFGSSMLMVVLDDSRARTRRLAVLNELAVTIARGQTHAPMLQAALGKLKTATASKAAWFRVMEDNNLVPTQHVGLSPDALRVMAQVGMDDTLARVLAENRATVVRHSEARSELIRQQLKKSGIHHVVIVPVVGKKSVIGTLSFGFAGRRRHGRYEMEFLETAAQQLGIAAENLRLLEQVLRSQRQWMNTFDS
ncbi:MAG TPA: GAF domain-containing protein, partial [Terracidiphilus sp.]